MRKREKVCFIIEKLSKVYPNPKCALNFSNGLELLIATRLSAQCTDKRVNEVTPALFKRFPNALAFAEADVSEIEEYIKSCGLYREKAKSIKAFSVQIIENFNGEIPKTLEELTTLSGVGRKTANLIMGELHGKEAYICDTHCIRLSNRLGLTKSTNPEIVEKDLRKSVLPEESLNFCHRLVQYGRDVCSARSPKCEACVLKDICGEKK